MCNEQYAALLIEEALALWRYNIHTDSRVCELIMRDNLCTCVITRTQGLGHGTIDISVTVGDETYMMHKVR